MSSRRCRHNPTVVFVSTPDGAAAIVEISGSLNQWPPVCLFFTAGVTFVAPCVHCTLTAINLYFISLTYNARVTRNYVCTRGAVIAFINDRQFVMPKIMVIKVIVVLMMITILTLCTVISPQ